MLSWSILQYFRPSLSSFVFKTFVLSNFEWPLKTGFTVHTSDNGNVNAIKINGSSISSCYLHLVFEASKSKNEDVC